MKNNYSPTLVFAICFLVLSGWASSNSSHTKPTQNKTNSEQGVAVLTRPDIDYQVIINAQNPRIADITAFITPLKNQIFLNDKSHDTGLYHGWATFLHSITVTDNNNESIKSIYKSNGVWLLDSAVDGKVKVSYKMLLQHDRFPNELGDDELAYAQAWGLMWTGRALFITGHEKQNIYVKFELPDDWRVTTPWNRITHNSNVFHVKDTNRLINSAFMCGKHIEHELTHGNSIIRLGLGGKSVTAQSESFVTLTEDYFNVFSKLFGEPPIDNMLILAAEGRLLGGGVMGTSISMLFGEDLSMDHLPFVHYITAHEMYHLWNTNLNFNKQSEMYWFVEGFAEYMALLTALRSQAVDETFFLQQVGQRVQNYQKSLMKTSMIEAGKNKLQNYNLIYSGGMMIAMTLDLKIRSESNYKYSLDTLQKYIYSNYKLGSKKSLSNNELIEAMKLSVGIDITDFIGLYVSGTTELPVENTLKLMGISFNKESNHETVNLTKTQKTSKTQKRMWNMLTKDF